MLPFVNATVSVDPNIANVAPADFNHDLYWTPDRRPLTVGQRSTQYSTLLNTLASGKLKQINTNYHLHSVNDFSEKLNAKIGINEDWAFCVNHYIKIEFTSFVEYIAHRLGFSETPWKYKVVPNCSISFMSDGTKITIYDHTSYYMGRRIGVSSYGDDKVYYGYGGLGEVIGILIKPYGYKVSPGKGLVYELNDSDGKLQDTISLGGLQTASHMLYLKTSGTVSPFNYLINLDALIGWFFKSKFISNESFFINIGGEYTGPPEYLNIPLFRQIVTRIQNSSNRANPPPTWEARIRCTSYPETITKVQETVWLSTVGVEGLAKKRKFEENIELKRLVGKKYDLNLISEVFQEKNVSAIKNRKEEFEKYISSKTDFNFFVLSSSEETILEELKNYAQLVAA